MFLLALTQVLATPPSVTPAAHLREARRALLQDDFEGARCQAKLALDEPGAHDQEAAWLMGLAWQYDGHPDDALQLFRAARARQPLGAFIDDLDLSISEALAQRGEHKEALRSLRRAKRGRSFDVGEAERFALDRAMWKLEGGSLRRGTKRLLKVLDDVDPNLATWHQARARTQLVHQWLDIADQLGTSSPELLERRALLLAHAREQLDETVDNGYDRFTLDQLHRLGRSFERLGDDVVSVYGNLHALPEDQRQRVEKVWTKARSFYDLAERHATRVVRTEEARLNADAASFLSQKFEQL